MDKAFTLAEVLITIGIIGIVAALTLPNLIEEHQKKETSVKLQKMYSTLNQVIQKYSADNETPIDNFKNNCVTYLICNKYRMSVQDIDLSIPEELKQMEAQSIKEVLGQAVECFQRLKVGIDRTMERDENARSNRDYER